MTLVRFDNVSLEFGDVPLLVHIEFGIELGERVCLIGRNGAGKSSLLKLITGELEPDHGNIEFQSGMVVSQLAQTMPGGLDRKVFDVVESGLADLRRMCADYQKRSALPLDAKGLKELEALQHNIEVHGGWDLERRIETILTELNLPADRPLRELSNGWRRRVALAQALVCNPELLLLDEPTNHLDLSTIEWLEGKVHAFSGSVLFVTHDRVLTQRLATRIVELDRGRVTSWPGDYANFLVQKQKTLQDEARHNALFDKRLAQEEAWIREGIKARRTRNEGRVRALQAMRLERAKRLQPLGKARVRLQVATPSGRKVIDARRLSYRYGGAPVIDDFSIKIMRGDRLGIVGNNGVGKSTLLRLLIGDLSPQQGAVKLGTHLDIGYFDQQRQDLNPEKTIAENVGDGREHININGKDQHIVSYLTGFLFSPKRAMTPVKALSGGECNRVLLAKLFTRPSNLLVLDEPTNDLDIETLEVLEARLVEYRGTLIVVSHDREFLDNVVTSVVVFEEGAEIREYVGNFSDWLRHGKRLAELDNPNKPILRNEVAVAPVVKPGANKPRKLSYHLQRELDTLPAKIETLEREVETLQARIDDPGFYDRPFAEVQPVLDELVGKQQELEQSIERWSGLEDMQDEVKS
ncbi:MAG: ATP-binding cassette domain-containing protein [Gammaproteobacteria bacterium]|nr:ATP-binding cassette domain-containing protein [Gammaproteobacteria bacterium]MDH3465956.1 ATP-binding cassette domain-containing protein [Gammaproteobacteria bacterium]